MSSGIKSGEICFDHCHSHGHFRGWLCHGCNTTIGAVHDSAKILRHLADYVKRRRLPAIKLPHHRLNSVERTELLGKPLKRCEVCGSPKRICADHSHRTYLFRGWLCHTCNVALMCVKDSPKILRKLADYLDNDKLKQKEKRKSEKANKYKI